MGGRESHSHGAVYYGVVYLYPVPLVFAEIPSSKCVPHPVCTLLVHYTSHITFPSSSSSRYTLNDAIQTISTFHPYTYAYTSDTDSNRDLPKADAPAIRSERRASTRIVVINKCLFCV
jgi:hypothetical protein